MDTRLDELATLLGRVVRTHGGGAGFGPAGETYDQRRARALVLLATPTEITRLLRLADGASDSADGDSAGADGAGPDAAGLAAVCLYVHLRADGLLEVERLGILTAPTVADLLTGHTGPVTVTPVIDLNTTYTSPGYQPSQRLREQTRLINPTCRFPFCERPSRDCDHEHPTPWPRGPTDTTNAGIACRSHHRVKTHSDWKVHQPATGIYVWQAPTGHVYIVTPQGTHPME